MKKLKNSFKKCTAFVLALALTVTSINLSAFADVITGPVIYNSDSYNTIEEALDNAKDNGDKTPIIYLKEDIDFGGSISLEASENVTISSYTDSKVTMSIANNGNHIESTGFIVAENAKLTLHNIDIHGNWIATTDSDGKVSYSTSYGIKASTFVISGDLILNNSIIKNYYYTAPIIELDSGNLYMQDQSGINHIGLSQGGKIITSKGVSSITGGHVSGMDSYNALATLVSASENGAEITIDSVTFDSNIGYLANGYKVIVQNCILTNNRYINSAGVEASYGYIYNCDFMDNEGNNTIRIAGDSDNESIGITKGEIFNCTFDNNKGSVRLESANVLLGGNIFREQIYIDNSKVNIVLGEINSEMFGTLQVDSNIFENNTVSAIYVEENSEVVINQANFVGNKANAGAAIYNNGIVSLHNVVFNGNAASGTNSNNTIKVTKGDAVYNNGTLYIYSEVNFGDNNIYECGGSQLIIKEDLLLHSDINKIYIALEKTVESRETIIAKYETDNSQESAYQSVLSGTWYVQSVSAKKNGTMAANGDTIVFNADTLDKTITFVDEAGVSITGVVYEITKKSNGDTVSLGYTEASDENGQITVQGMYDGSYTLTLVSTPSSVEGSDSTEKINFMVDTDAKTVTSGGAILSDDFTIKLANYNPVPIAVISVNKTSVRINEEITFAAGDSSDDTGIVNYQWSFSDGISLTGETVTHSFTKEGTYFATLTVKDNKGKFSTQTCKIIVQGTLDNQYKLTVNVMESNTGNYINKATVEVVDTNGNSIYAATDANGIAEVYVNGNSSYTVNGYAGGYYYKTVDVYMLEKSRSINMYLSNLETIVGELKVERITKEEAEGLGVDTSAEDNQVYYKQEIDVAFTYDESESKPPVTFISIINGDGRVLKELFDDSDSSYKVHKVKDGFYLAVQCDVTWMSEMFDVKLIVLNNSAKEEIQNCEATLKLPGGLSLAKMVSEEQSETVEIGTVETGGSYVHNWIVKGDNEGIYSIEANVNGEQVSDNGDGSQNRTEFNYSYICTTPIKVLGGTALNLYITGQSCAVSPDYMNIQYALVNVSDINIHNLELAVSKGDTYAVGSKDDILDENNNVIHSKLDEKTDIITDKIQKIDMLKPGEAVSVCTTVYIGGNFASKEYYIQDAVSNQIGGNMKIPTISQLQFIPSRYKKSIYENSNVHESCSADPVDMLTGAFVYDRNDATILGLKEFSVKRTYSSSTGSEGVYGYGWRDDFTYYLQMTENGDMTMNFPNGDRAYFEKLEDGSYAAAVGSELSLEVTRANNSLGNIVEVEGSENEEGIPMYIDTDFTGATVTTLDGTVYTFNKYMKVSSIVDVEGYITNYNYNSSGFVTKVSTNTGSVSFTYDNLNRITKATMSSGETVEYGYDADGYLNKVTNADGDTMYYAYDSKGYILSVTDFLGNESVINEYDDYGRVIKQYVQGEGTYEFTYDDENKINICTGENGYIHAIKYDDSYKIVEDTENGTATYEYDDNSWLLSETDAEGNKTSYEYDSFGRIVKIIYKDVNAETTYTEEYKYDVNGKIVESTNKNGARTYYGYDSNNRLAVLIDANGNEINYVYDDKGNVILEIHSDGGIKSYTYDEAGRKLSETDENGNCTVYRYDTAGRTLSITSSDGSSRSYTYSNAGKLLSETDANGNVTTYTVNANGYTTDVVYSDGTTENTTYNQQNKAIGTVDRLGNSTYYTYDTAGNVTSYKNQRGFTTYYTYDKNRQLTTLKNALGYKWSYTYDTNGNITKVTDPLSGTATTTYDANGNVLTYTDENGEITTYTYDGVGNVVSSTDAEGNETTYAYDNNNNVVEVKNAMGDITTYTYDQMNRVIAITDALGHVTSYTYDYRGQVKSETDSEGNTSYYEYDSMGRLILKTDALGQETGYTYDNNGNVTSIIRPNGGIITYTYDTNNNCTSVINERGYETRYTYGPTGLLTKERKPGGIFTYYSYYSNGNLKKVTYPDNTCVKYEYDAADQLIKITTSEGRITEYTYDNLGRVSTEKTPNGSVTKYTYDSVGNILSVTDGDGNITKYDYDALGQVTSVTDANNGVVSYEYDANGNVISETDANGNTTTHTYDGASRLKSTTDSYGNSRTYTYDGVGNVTSVIDESGNETIYEYDELSRLVKKTNAAGETTEYAYDQIGNVIMETRADGKSKRYVYDLAGNLTSEYNYRGRRTKYTYDTKNELSSITRGDYWEKYTRDNMGRVITTTYSDGSTEEYTYDSYDNVTSYKDKNGNVTTYTYDSMNNMIQSTDAEGFVTDYEYDINGNVTKQILHRTVEDSDIVEDEVTTYAYDGCGNLVSKTDPLGSTTTYEYDLNGNCISETNNEGEVVKTYTYDALNRVSEKTVGNKTTTYEYNNTSAVMAIVSSDNDIRYVRDGLNRITSSTQNGKTTSYTYNELGQQTKITYPDGIVNKMSYNVNGKLYRTITANGLVQYGFDLDDNIISKTTRNSTIDEEEDPAEELEAYTYDINGRLLTTTYTIGEKTVVTDEYAYDYNGNVLSHIKRDVETGEETKNTYTYDSSNRLKTESKEAAAQTTSTAYEYDSVGNLIKETTDGLETTYEYNNLNQLISKISSSQSLTYIYDGNGALSLEKDAVTGKVYGRYTNDENGKMIKAISYAYADESTEGNTRITTTTKTTDRKLDDNGYVTEETTSVGSFLTVNGMTVVKPQTVEDATVDYVYDYTSDVPSLIQSSSTDGTVVDYLYALGRTGAIVTNADGDDGDESTEGFKSLYNLSTDRNGTTRFATDREGNVVAKTLYGTWAEVEDVTKVEVSDTIDVDITSAYTGYIYNEEQNIWNAGERVYSATIRHFTSIDPEPGNVYEKMRVNAYVYAGNNPTTYIDPNGRLFGSIGNAMEDAFNWFSDTASNAWNWVSDTVESVVDAVKGTFDSVSCVLKSEDTQMAAKLLIGSLGLAIGMVITVATGGTVVPVVGTVVGGTLMGGAIGAGGYTVSTAVSGSEWNWDDMKEAAVNGFVDGYMSSGVTVAVGAAAGWYHTSNTTARYVDDDYCVTTLTSENKTHNYSSSWDDYQEFSWDIEGGLDTIIKNGKVSIDDIKTNPSAFSGKSAEEIADVLRNSGYDVTIKNSTRSRSGAQIIQINNPGGGKNISQVQVSPGGGRHGSNPYVKISTTDQGIIKIVDGIESTYKTDGKETATIIFSGGN